jgi:chemotaxis signal transduction protein
MTTMVCFTAAGNAYCLPVGAVRSVGTTHGMVQLPDPADDVTGILPGDPSLTVISPLGAGGSQLLVIETADTSFGLLVDEVTGLKKVQEADIRSAPRGQDRSLVSGTLDSDDGPLLLVVDPVALAGRL